MRNMQKPRTMFVLGIGLVVLIVCLAFLAAYFLEIGPFAEEQDQTREVVFKTPEEAITFYMQGVAQGDIPHILQACAADEMAAGFSLDVYVERLRVLSLTFPAPSDYPFYAEINQAQFSSQLLYQVRNLAYGLLTTEDQLLEGFPVRIDPEETSQFTEQFIAEADPARLAQLEVVEIGLPHPDIVADEHTQTSWDWQTRFYGADEFTERVALVLFEGNTYVVGFQLLRYGDTWKISGATSVLGGLPTTGAPQATTEEEFRELIASD